jgi:hypothetical protein
MESKDPLFVYVSTGTERHSTTAERGEFPEAALLISSYMGSFDCVCRSLRERQTPLRMTGLSYYKNREHMDKLAMRRVGWDW